MVQKTLIATASLGVAVLITGLSQLTVLPREYNRNIDTDRARCEVKVKRREPLYQLVIKDPLQDTQTETYFKLIETQIYLEEIRQKLNDWIRPVYGTSFYSINCINK